MCVCKKCACVYSVTYKKEKINNKLGYEFGLNPGNGPELWNNV